MKSERYAYIVLTLMCAGFAAISVLISINYVKSSERNFCDIINASTKTVVRRPAVPKAHPSEELSWEWYERFKKLDMKLGC